MKNAKAFASFLIARKGLQQITVDGYVSTYKRFSKLIGDEPTISKAEKFIYDFFTSNYSYSYKLNTVLSLEQYMEFIGKPTKFGRRKKPKPIIKNTLTEAEVTTMIFNCRNIREKAIIALLAYSGIRNLEMCNLKVEDFLYSNNAIRIIKGKGIKDGLSEIAPECTEILLKYLSDYPREKSDFVFTTLQKGNKMATNDIRKWVKVIARRAKIEKRVYPHLFRHSMTANMLLRGADLISLKNQLRHSWLETTLHYANSIVFVEKNRYQKFAPSYI
jgi:integrase/recombinase XerD